MSKDWFDSSFDDGGETTKRCSQSKSHVFAEPKLKTKKITKVDDKKLEKFQEIDWLKTFKPIQISELSVHPKKLEEVQNWFKFSLAKSKNRILLIEGPPGCCKSITLSLVAKDNGFEVLEWTNSTDIEISILNSDNSSRDFVNYQNQVTKFSEFLLSSSRFRSVFNKKKRLLLVKDFPNTFSKKTEEFWSILREYITEAKVPLVFIVTDANSNALNIAFNLFPENIRLEMRIDTITFNAVAPTLMKRGLQRIIQMIESDSNFSPFFKKPSDQEMASLIEQSQGDVRNAVLSLNFAAQLSEHKLVSKQKPSVKGEKKKKPTMKSSNDGGLGKNETLSLMHGIGRVLYPKLEINPITKVKELTHKPEDIAESFSSQPNNFVQMINSNYMKCYSDIHEIQLAADFFSVSDCIEAEYRDPMLNQLNLNMMIRATMILNEHPAGGFRPIAAKANKKWLKTKEANESKFNSSSKILNNGNMLARNDFFCDYNPLLSIIMIEGNK